MIPFWQQDAKNSKIQIDSKTIERKLSENRINCTRASDEQPESNHALLGIVIFQLCDFHVFESSPLRPLMPLKPGRPNGP